MTKKKRNYLPVANEGPCWLVDIDGELYWIDVFDRKIQKAELPANSPSLVEIAKPVSVSPSADGRPIRNIISTIRKDTE